MHSSSRVPTPLCIYSDYSYSQLIISLLLYRPICSRNDNYYPLLSTTDSLLPNLTTNNEYWSFLSTTDHYNT